MDAEATVTVTWKDANKEEATVKLSKNERRLVREAVRSIGVGLYGEHYQATFKRVGTVAYEDHIEAVARCFDDPPETVEDIAKDMRACGRIGWAERLEAILARG